MTTFKVLASQAKTINRYKNLRTKVAKCCANIYCNKPCLSKKVNPKYAHVFPMCTVTLYNISVV